MSGHCDHEWDPHPTTVVVPAYSLRPAGDASPSIVPCKKCGTPINRGRFTGLAVEESNVVGDKAPGRYAEESVYSNFDHALDDEVVKELLRDPEGVHAQHAAWDFCGYVWRGKDDLWHEQVWRYHSLVETRSADDIGELIASVNADYGTE